MKKIIFLDIDGVMNSINGEGPYLADMEVSKLELLKSLIEETNSEGIVLISDRRFSSHYMNELESVLDQYEIALLDSLRDPNGDEDNRGKQIDGYLSIHNDIDRIVILDDNDDGISILFKEEYIEVNKFYGLNKEVYLKAVKALKE